MAFTFVAGCQFTEKLAEALGLDGRCIETLVIECRRDSLIRVYWTEALDGKNGPALIEAMKAARQAWQPEIQQVADVRVSDKGEVTTNPLMLKDIAEMYERLQPAPNNNPVCGKPFCMLGCICDKDPKFVNAAGDPVDVTQQSLELYRASVINLYKEGKIDESGRLTPGTIVKKADPYPDEPGFQGFAPLPEFLKAKA